VFPSQPIERKTFPEAGEARSIVPLESFSADLALCDSEVVTGQLVPRSSDETQFALQSLHEDYQRQLNLQARNHQDVLEQLKTQQTQFANLQQLVMQQQQQLQYFQQFIPMIAHFQSSMPVAQVTTGSVLEAKNGAKQAASIFYAQNAQDRGEP